MTFPIYESEARGILSKTSGFIAQAGFTHSLTPARNCTFGCTYCYVPTMRVQGGLRQEDWRRWGQFTTFKSNAPELLKQALRPNQRIYCSPLVDPYQPAEEQRMLMPRILEVLINTPPEVFCLQTRGLSILRDLRLLLKLAERTTVRISFSLTTNRDEVRRWYEPHCAPIPQRVAVMKQLTAAGLRVHATLAPLLPCDPDQLVEMAVAASNEGLVGDAFHSRANKPTGATTRPESLAVSAKHGFTEWHEPLFQESLLTGIETLASQAGRGFAVGPAGFAKLSEPVEQSALRD